MRHLLSPHELVIIARMYFIDNFGFQACCFSIHKIFVVFSMSTYFSVAKF